MNTRERILSTASQLFGEVGFDAASTRQIADRSGVNKALIHYHFNNKGALFDSVFDAYYQRLVQTLMAPLETGGTIRERFLGMIESYVDFLAENRDLGCVIQWEASGGKNLDRIVAHMVPLFQRGIALIEQLYPQTRSGALAAPQLLVSFYGMIVTYFVHKPLLERLLNVDVLSAESLDLRKEHLRQLLETVLQTIEKESER